VSVRLVPAGVTGIPEEMAAAELAEETGFTADRLEGPRWSE
jgi:8-oxo-dGDP phosphatase